MTRTNIRSSRALVSRAGLSFEEVACVPNADYKLIYIISGALTQEHLDRYTDILREDNVGSWIQKSFDNQEIFTYCQGDRNLPIPKINVSNGMQGPGKYMPQYADKVRYDSLADCGPEESELAYILIVQGQTGDSRCKLVVETSYERATSAMMYEVLNGYSIVFTAAILKANLAKLHDKACSLRVVQDRKALNTVGGDLSGPCIRFWC